MTIAPFDLGNLLRGATEAFQSLTDVHELVLELPDDLPHARGDVMATDIIIGQLLENAFKYSPDGGTVAVRVALRGDPVTRAVNGSAGDIVIDVEDEGVGISPEDRERIFERFVQGEAGDRRRFGGIGLGLFIVRRLALAQCGDVSAHSRPGGGTRMRVILPAAD